MGRDEAKRKKGKSKSIFLLKSKTDNKKKEKQRYLNVHECIKSSNSSQR